MFKSLSALLFFLIFLPAALRSQDSTLTHKIQTIEIISSPKEIGSLNQQHSALSTLSESQLERNNIGSLKDLSAKVPNLFIPDYGSRLTSAIYVRGIGSRINTPAVGLYVDNIPYFDKSAFDFSFYDIERIDVLRGPQGTLYGRNSMGGLIRVNTRSPFSYQGTDLKLGVASANNQTRAALTHYHRISEKFAFSAGGYWSGCRGFFKNSCRNNWQDDMRSGGGRLRAIFRDLKHWRIDGSIGYDYNDEGGYPYFYMGQIEGEETHEQLKNQISANEQSSYRRKMLNAGVNVQYQGREVVLNAITGFQSLKDRMFLDQDFLSDNVYTMEQKQRLNILSQELILKNREQHTWEWLAGLSFSKQWLRTTAPVTFKSDGVNMLENNINSMMPDLSKMGVQKMGVGIDDKELVMGGSFFTPTWNVAAFHQSTLNLTSQLSATLGLRLENEHTSLRYIAPAQINYNFQMLSSRMPLELNNLCANLLYRGRLSHDYTQLLPKVSLSYKFSENAMLYSSVSKGHRSGGYNVQMFSDILQTAMRTQMIEGIKNEAIQQGAPEMVINNIFGQIPTSEAQDVTSTVAFKPEYSWNYELGSRLSTKDGQLSIDGALFLTSVRQQQIARFAPSGLGRMMSNAGRSRSYGLELSATWQPHKKLCAWLNYGFTHAVFTRYNAGNSEDFTHNRVPFIPKHTLSLGGDYIVKHFGSPASPSRCSLTLGASMQAQGRIYWTENNSQSQSLYTTFTAHAKFDFRRVSLNLWGQNLFNRHFQSFYFESMNRGYQQKGRPRQVGVDLRVQL